MSYIQISRVFFRAMTQGRNERLFTRVGCWSTTGKWVALHRNFIAECVKDAGWKAILNSALSVLNSDNSRSLFPFRKCCFRAMTQSPNDRSFTRPGLLVNNGKCVVLHRNFVDEWVKDAGSKAILNSALSVLNSDSSCLVFKFPEYFSRNDAKSQ